MTHQNVGRPKIYHTDEEKKEASRLSCNRVYWKKQTKTKADKHDDRIEAKRVRDDAMLNLRAVRKEVKDNFVAIYKEFNISQLRLIEAYISQLSTNSLNQD